MAQVKRVGPEEIQRNKLFGPVYHGTTAENLKTISQDGFKVFKGAPRTGEVSNGYQQSEYSQGFPPPIHHLGFGIYFTTIKNIAKNYNYGSTKGLVQYYLNVPRLETINFGSVNTMMSWWLKNGYVPQKNMNMNQWIQATQQLTDGLSSKFDGVWFKGKGLRRLLDGDQIVVFNPANIFQLDVNLAQEYEDGETILKIGNNVRFKNTKIKAKIIKIDPWQGEDFWSPLIGSSKYKLTLNMTLKAVEELRAIYFEPLLKIMPNYKDSIYIKNRIENGMTEEEVYRHFANYLINVINRQCPSKLLEN